MADVVERLLSEDSNWWQHAGDVLNLDLRAWTVRASARFVDRATEQTVEMTGAVAGRLLEIRARLSQAGAGGVVPWPAGQGGGWTINTDFLEQVAKDMGDWRVDIQPEQIEAVLMAPSVLAALAASPSAGEPVAWRWRLKGRTDWIVTVNRDDIPEQFGVTGRDKIRHIVELEVQPLYATPPAPVQTASVEAVRVLNDNGKRWRVESADGRWEIKPTGHIDADEARGLCERIAASLTAPTQGAPTPAASNPQSACAGEEAGQAAGEAHRAPAATPSSPVSSPSPAGGVREAAIELLSHLKLYDFIERDPSGELHDRMYDLTRALSSPATGEVVEAIAAWLEKQRSEVPAHGWEFAAALRAGGPDLAALNPAPGHGEGGL